LGYFDYYGLRYALKSIVIINNSQLFTQYVMTFLFVMIIGANLISVFGSEGKASQTEQDTSYIPAKSGYQIQKEETDKLLRKAGKIAMEVMQDLGKQILGDSAAIREDPEYLYQQIRLEYAKLTKDFNTPSLKASELLKRLKDTNIVLIDVRQEIEQRVSMIPGSITPYQLAKKFRTPRSVKGKIFITYATIGYRSGIYAKELLKKKLDVVNLEGGILAWSHEKGPLIRKSEKDSSQTTNEIHVYDKSWNFIHPDYVPKW